MPIYMAALSSQTKKLFVKTVLKERGSGMLRLATGTEMAPCPIYYAMTWEMSVIRCALSNQLAAATATAVVTN